MFNCFYERYRKTKTAAAATRKRKMEPLELVPFFFVIVFSLRKQQYSNTFHCGMLQIENAKLIVLARTSFNLPFVLWFLCALAFLIIENNRNAALNRDANAKFSIGVLMYCTYYTKCRFIENSLTNKNDIFHANSSEWMVPIFSHNHPHTKMG